MASVELISGNPIVVKATEHATDGAWKAGDLLIIGTNGKMQIATAGAIYAIARSDASGTENTVHEIELISFDNVYSARYSGTTSVALIGDCVDFTFTAGAHTLSESGATTDAYVVGLDTRDAVGTSGGRLLIKFYPALGDAAF